MNIDIEEKAKEWIKTKGKTLTIKTVQIKGCCVGGDVQELITILKKPSDVSRYNLFEVDSVSVYIEKNVFNREKILLKLSGFGLFKSISAKATAN